MSDRYGFEDYDHKSEDWIGGPPLNAQLAAWIHALRCELPEGRYAPVYSLPASEPLQDARREDLDKMHSEVEEERAPLSGASLRRLSATRDALALELSDLGFSITRAGDIADRLVKRLQEPLP